MLHSIYEKFTDDEWGALQKAKGKKTWHDFIVADKSHKEIEEEVLKNLCLDFDLRYGAYTEDEFEGFALLNFFFEEVAKTENPPYMYDYDKLLTKRKKEKKEGGE